MTFHIVRTTKHMDGYDASSAEMPGETFRKYETARKRLRELQKEERDRCDVPGWRSTFRIIDKSLGEWA